MSDPCLQCTVGVQAQAVVNARQPMCQPGNTLAASSLRAAADDPPRSISDRAGGSRDLKDLASISGSLKRAEKGGGGLRVVGVVRLRRHRTLRLNHVLLEGKRADPVPYGPCCRTSTVSNKASQDSRGSRMTAVVEAYIQVDATTDVRYQSQRKQGGKEGKEGMKATDCPVKIQWWKDR